MSLSKPNCAVVSDAKLHIFTPKGINNAGNVSFSGFSYVWKEKIIIHHSEQGELGIYDIFGNREFIPYHNTLYDPKAFLCKNYLLIENRKGIDALCLEDFSFHFIEVSYKDITPSEFGDYFAYFKQVENKWQLILYSLEEKTAFISEQKFLEKPRQLSLSEFDIVFQAYNDVIYFVYIDFVKKNTNIIKSYKLPGVCFLKASSSYILALDKNNKLVVLIRHPGCFQKVEFNELKFIDIKTVKNKNKFIVFAENELGEKTAYTCTMENYKINILSLGSVLKDYKISDNIIYAFNEDGVVYTYDISKKELIDNHNFDGEFETIAI